MKFEFGTGKIEKKNIYNVKDGYGFLNSSWIEAGEDDILSKINIFDNGADFVQDCSDCIQITNNSWNEEKNNDGFITTFVYVNTSIFCVDLEPADYKVKVVLKNNEISAKTQILLQGIKKPLMEENVNEEFLEKNYVISLVENQLKIQFEGTPAQIVSLEILKLEKRKAGEKKSIYIASDSTVMTYRANNYPQTGWGQRLGLYFNDRIEIRNKAIGGRSSKSFVNEGRLDEILNEIKPNDYLFIQFGHNDATMIRPARYVSERHFEKWIQIYVDGARQRGAIPVLVTPVPLRIFTDGKCDISFKGYREVFLKMAKEQNIPLLDLGKSGAEYLTELGFEESKAVFLFVPAGVFEAYPNGSTDRAHYQEFGADMMARLLIGELEKNSDLLELKECIKKAEIPQNVPEVPRNLKIVKTSSSNVTMNWEKAEATRLYYIFRKPENGDFKQCGATAFTTYIDTNCEENQEYSYKVRAWNDAGHSEFSNIQTTKTKAANMRYIFDGEVKNGWINVERDCVYLQEKGYGFEKENLFMTDAANGDYSVKLVTDRRDVKLIDVRVIDGKIKFEVASNILNAEITQLSLAPSALRYYELNLESTPPTVVITWTATESAVSYNVYRKTDKQENFEVIYNTKDTTYYEESASLGNVYTYYITGVMEDGTETAPTNEVEISMVV